MSQEVLDFYQEPEKLTEVANIPLHDSIALSNLKDTAFNSFDAGVATFLSGVHDNFTSDLFSLAKAKAINEGAIAGGALFLSPEQVKKQYDVDVGKPVTASYASYVSERKQFKDNLTFIASTYGEDQRNKGKGAGVFPIFTGILGTFADPVLFAGAILASKAVAGGASFAGVAITSTAGKAIRAGLAASLNGLFDATLEYTDQKAQIASGERKTLDVETIAKWAAIGAIVGGLFDYLGSGSVKNILKNREVLAANPYNFVIPKKSLAAEIRNFEKGPHSFKVLTDVDKGEILTNYFRQQDAIGAKVGERVDEVIGGSRIIEDRVLPQGAVEEVPSSFRTAPDLTAPTKEGNRLSELPENVDSFRSDVGASTKGVATSESGLRAVGDKGGDKPLGFSSEILDDVFVHASYSSTRLKSILRLGSDFFSGGDITGFRPFLEELDSKIKSTGRFLREGGLNEKYNKFFKEDGTFSFKVFDALDEDDFIDIFGTDLATLKHSIGREVDQSAAALDFTKEFNKIKVEQKAAKDAANAANKAAAEKTKADNLFFKERAQRKTKAIRAVDKEVKAIEKEAIRSADKQIKTAEKKAKDAVIAANKAADKQVKAAEKKVKDAATAKVKEAKAIARAKVKDAKDLKKVVDREKAVAKKKATKVKTKKAAVKVKKAG